LEASLATVFYNCLATLKDSPGYATDDFNCARVGVGSILNYINEQLHSNSSCWRFDRTSQSDSSWRLVQVLASHNKNQHGDGLRLDSWEYD